jgi:hypothetical protein
MSVGISGGRYGKKAIFFGWIAASQLLSEKIKKSRKSFVREGLRVLWTGFRGRFVF